MFAELLCLFVELICFFKMKTKRKYLAQWVQIVDPDSTHYKKCGVVMDEEYIHNGIMRCRVIIGKDVVPVEAQHLILIQV